MHWLTRKTTALKVTPWFTTKYVITYLTPLSMILWSVTLHNYCHCDTLWHSLWTDSNYIKTGIIIISIVAWSRNCANNTYPLHTSTQHKQANIFTNNIHFLKHSWLFDNSNGINNLWNCINTQGFQENMRYGRYLVM